MLTVGDKNRHANIHAAVRVFFFFFFFFFSFFSSQYESLLCKLFCVTKTQPFSFKYNYYNVSTTKYLHVVYCFVFFVWLCERNIWATFTKLLMLLYEGFLAQSNLTLLPTCPKWPSTCKMWSSEENIYVRSGHYVPSITTSVPVQDSLTVYI